MITTLALLTAVSFTESAPVIADEYTVDTTVIVVERHQDRPAARIWACSEWRESAVGGRYRDCEYVERGREPKGF